MASAPSPFVSTKETTNYARLCRLLVDVGSQALRDTFDKIHPPATLHAIFSSHSVHYATLQTLYRGRRKVLNPTQWGKLYPVHSPVSSASFDITLLTVLLRNICGLIPPVAGWDNLPPPADTSIADDIARVKYYRNTVYGHASQASVDDTSLNTYWPEIREALVRLGGPSYRAYIDFLEHDCMDPDIEEHYRELMKQWKKDDDSIKDKLDEMEEFIRDSSEQTKSEIKEMKESLDTLTALLEEKKDEGRVRDELNEMKFEIGNISGKLDALTASRQETKDEDPFDPSELIDGIRQLYETHEGWLTPFPWCEEIHFHLNDIYTRLKMISRKKTRGTATDENVKMSAIFKPHEECSKPRTVLIEGKPGMGKTIYCKKLVHDWATGKQEVKEGFPRFETVLLLKCRDIKSNLWEAIDDQVLPQDIQEGIREKFFNFIRHNQSSVLLVLDGLDELPESKLPAVLEIIQGRVLPKCHLVVTAREEAGVKVRKYCDTLLEIEGFAEEDAREFICKYFRTMEDLAKNLLLKLDDDEDLRDITANPLNTALLCLLCEEFQGILPESRNELYLEITECVLRRYRKKKGLSETSEKLTEMYKTQLKHLGSIALNCLREETLDFEESELADHKKYLSEFGFLSMQPGGSKLRPCRRYAFPHKSFQEFFAGFYLSCQLRDEEITPDDLVSDTIFRYFNKLKYVLVFVCGIVAAQFDKGIAMALEASIRSQDNKHGGDSEEVALECIKECKRAKSDGCLATAASPADTVEGNTTPRSLRLRSNNIADAGAASLFDKMEGNSTLGSLPFISKDFADAGAASLYGEMEGNSTLGSLRFRSNNITDAGATSVYSYRTLYGKMEGNSTLGSLPFISKDFADAGAASLFDEMEGNSTLGSLPFICKDFADAGAASLYGKMEGNSTLGSLRFRSNNITDAGATSVYSYRTLYGKMEGNSTLGSLRFRSNNITDAKATSVYSYRTLYGKMEGNSTLGSLRFRSNNITDAGATSVYSYRTLYGKMEGNSTLGSLRFRSNNFADAGATSLNNAIQGNSTLKLLHSLHLSSGAKLVHRSKKPSLCRIMNIADAGAASLAFAFGGCLILFSLMLALLHFLTRQRNATELDLVSNSTADAGVAEVSQHETDVVTNKEE
ncbi:hypothetical protein ACROYT_G026861 [Oculina patagonica]